MQFIEICFYENTQGTITTLMKSFVMDTIYNKVIIFYPVSWQLGARSGLENFTLTGLVLKVVGLVSAPLFFPELVSKSFIVSLENHWCSIKEDSLHSMSSHFFLVYFFNSKHDQEKCPWWEVKTTLICGNKDTYLEIFVMYYVCLVN